MDDEFLKQLDDNGRRFHRFVDRIAEKYSMLQQYEDAGIVVDMNETHAKALEHYFTQSRKTVDTFSKRFAGLKKEPQSLQDSTRYPPLDHSCKERSELFEATSSPDKHDAEIESTSGTVASPWDESLGNYTVLSDQPEDQDQQLEMTLSSQGSCLGQLYPDMLNQIGEAWKRQHVSEAAGSVLRRYRRWRKSNRPQSTDSFLAPQRANCAKVIRRREVFDNRHNPQTPGKSLMVKAGSQSPAKMLTNGQKWQNCLSPTRREATAVVMDMPALSELHERKLNKTFNYSTYTLSPARSSHLSTRQPQDLSFRMKESCVSPRQTQTAGCSGFAARNTLLNEMYSSPVRQSPYKSRSASRSSFSEQSEMYGSPVRKSPFRSHWSRESPRQSPHASVSSPKSPHGRQSISREQSQIKSHSNLLSSMLPKSTLPWRRTLEYSDLHLSPRLGSPRPGQSQRGHHRLRRNLSFDDASLTSRRESYTMKDFDDVFIKLYHKLVCLSKYTPMQGHPCRFCAKTSEGARGHSFSNLAALALSPHRPLLRKRHRDLDVFPHSKRFKEDDFTKYL